MVIVTRLLYRQVSVTLDHIRAKQWKEMLVRSGIDSQMLCCYSGIADIVLRWAETMPIWYLQKYITNGLCIAIRNCSVLAT